MLHVYADGGYSAATEKAAYAYAIYDPSGQLLAQHAAWVPESRSNNQMEYLGATEGLLEAMTRFKERRLALYSDSQLLVEQYHGRYQCKDPALQELLAHLRFVASMAKVEVVWIPREKNAYTDALVKAVILPKVKA
jgi:ribonuclease HI